MKSVGTLGVLLLLWRRIRMAIIRAKVPSDIQVVRVLLVQAPHMLTIIAHDANHRQIIILISRFLISVQKVYIFFFWILCMINVLMGRLADIFRSIFQFRDV